MKRDIKHVRHHAGAHKDAHEKLQDLLKHDIEVMEKKVEKVWPTFIASFIGVFVILILGTRISQIDFSANKDVAVKTTGFQKGIVSIYKVEEQATKVYRNFLAQIPSFGHELGVQATAGVSKGGITITDVRTESALKSAIEATTDISEGKHLTPVKSNQTVGLQKSILATYYLGEKTIDINSSLQSDTLLLSQINNALSTDIFQLLNQADDRATALDEYTTLLKRLERKAMERSLQLDQKILFLSNNAEANETQTQLSEEAFFSNLHNLNGPNAEAELARFIGLQESSAEIRAKIGAYSTTKQYFDFFIPRLDKLITEIDANRDPLIAGVKVVEIENMILPLIERQ